MIVTRVHVEYWKTKKSTPRFAAMATGKGKLSVPRARSGVDMIDACVNQHVDKYKVPHYVLDASNLMSLCRSYIRHGDDLLASLRRLSMEPGTVINPSRRMAYAKKWAQRVWQQRHLAQVKGASL